MPDKMLFKSCAMPAAINPMASIRLAIESFRSLSTRVSSAHLRKKPHSLTPEFFVPILHKYGFG
jgi:hypothetical protein